MATERQNSIMMTTSPYNSNKTLTQLINGVWEVESRIYNQVDNQLSKIHTVLPGETLQHIAYKYYGDSGYWSMIADVNVILNPFRELEEGMQLIIPDLSEVV